MRHFLSNSMIEPELVELGVPGGGQEGARRMEICNRNGGMRGLATFLDIVTEGFLSSGPRLSLRTEEDRINN